MSSKIQSIKDRVKNSTGSSLHGQLIDTSIIDEDKKANSNPNNSENVNVNVSEPQHNLIQPKKEKKKKFEELHTRDTFWIKNELAELLKIECDGERGEKTRLINEALELYFKKRK